MARVNYEMKLKALQQDLYNMGESVDVQIRNSIIALKNKNEELAKQVIEDDDLVDEYEYKIEEECIRIIAMEQPLARDLRKIIIAIKIITDLERMADHAVDIGKIVCEISNQEYIKDLVDIPKMAEIVEEMVKEAVDAYITENINKAEDICMMDDKVDSYYKSIISELENLMAKSPENIYQGSRFIIVTRLLERIADHATNICERVIYLQTGNRVELN